RRPQRHLDPGAGAIVSGNENPRESLSGTGRFSFPEIPPPPEAVPDGEAPARAPPRHSVSSVGVSAPHGDDGSARAIVAAFLANLGIALAKFVAFAVTGAASMLAEGVHSVADTGNQGLLFVGGRRARKPATRAHPFGFARERYFWSFVVAVVLFTAGSLFALLEGVDKLRHPHELGSWPWAVGTLAVAFALESFSLRTAVRESRELKGELPWTGFIRRAKVPELPVVLLEDTGALLGLAFALVGVGLAEVTGNARFDALGSIAIGVLLG